MADLGKVGISMLNMDDIADYLKIAKGFILKTDKASDTERVGGIESKYIAISDTSKKNPDGSIKIDRETIKNALHLDGHPVEYFATKEYGDQLKEDTRNVKKNYDQEIIELRDEFYQLRAELAKRGLLERHTPYAGFYDVFRTGDSMHLDGVVDTSKNDSTGPEAQRTIHVSDGFYDSVEVGDHLYLLDKNSNKDAVVEILEKLPDHETLRFTAGTGFDIKKGMVDVYRSRGMSMNGCYAFGQVKSYSLDDSVAMYTGLNDDTFSKNIPMDKDNPGYAYTFRIPKHMQKSYLSKVSVMIQAFGQTPDLIAYIIDEQNIAEWNKISKAIAEGTVLPDKDPHGQPLPTKLEDLTIAKSQTLSVDPSRGMYLADFNFYGTANVGSSYGFSNPNPYPYLSLQDDEQGRRIRYCLIIEPQGPLDKYEANNIKNCFLVECLKQTGTGPDLQINNTLFKYDSSQKEPIISHSATNTYDLYYGVTLLKAVERNFTPFPSGIYTARFQEPKPITGSHARLMLRVNREGMYAVAKGAQSTAAGNVGDHSTIALQSLESNYAPDFSGSRGNQVIIGSTICDVEEVPSIGSITVSKGLHIEPEDPVYPIGYEVSIKAYYDEWDPVNFVTKTKYSARFEMPLVTVIPDRYKKNERFTDRLIFEGSLHDKDGTIKPYNRFELEIYWRKSREKNDIVKVVNGSNEYPLAGAIQNLSLSIDRTMF
jgi:hypothetical protein